MAKPELLAPAGNWSCLRAAVEAGADAIYFGVEDMNMRVTAENFKLRELEKLTSFCHENNVKAYLALNTIIYEDELPRVNEILEQAKKAKVDAVICWDFAVAEKAKELAIPLHLSTQASVSNSEAIKYYEKQGFERIVLARECTLDQIKQITASTSIGIEVFIHGAMCVSISGRCFLSESLYGKSANRGECIQPCRRQYLINDAEEDKSLLVGNNFVLSPKDMCTIKILDKIVDTGACCLKIEGRNKGPEYVSTVVKAYRKALDAIQQNNYTPELKTQLETELKTVFNRGFSTGFYHGAPVDEWAGVYGSKATKKKQFVGPILNFYKKPSAAELRLDSSDLKIGNEILVMGPTTGVFTQKVESLTYEDELIKSAKKGSTIGLKLNKLARKGDKVYIFE